MAKTKLFIVLMCISFCLAWYDSDKVYVRQKCGQTVFVRDASVKMSLCRIGGNIRHSCEVIMVSKYSHEHLMVKMERTNLDRPWDWIEVFDGTSGKSILPQPFDRKKSFASSHNNLTFRFNFHSPKYKEVARKFHPVWEVTLIRFNREMSREKCENQGRRYKRGGGDDYRKKKEKYYEKYYGKKKNHKKDGEHYKKYRRIHCDGNRCLHHSLRCDGIPHCDDRSDEKDCHQKKKWVCILITACVVAVVLFSVVAGVIWCRKRRRCPDQDTTAEVTESDEKTPPTDEVGGDEKPPIDSIFCVEAGAIGGIPGAPEVVWTGELPPKYPDDPPENPVANENAEVDIKDVSEPSTPPPQYASRAGSEKDLIID